VPRLRCAECAFALRSLQGSENAFSLAAARGAPLPPALRAAAAADLEALQRLCLCETTLAGWVREAADEGSSSSEDDAHSAAWLAASRALIDTPLERADVAGDAHALASGFVGAPLSEAERRGWRERLGSAPRWRDRGDDLAALYRRHGAGAASGHAALTWRSDGATLAPLRPGAPSAEHAVVPDAAAFKPPLHHATLVAAAALAPVLLAHASCEEADLPADQPFSVLLHSAAHVREAGVAVAAMLADTRSLRAVALPRGELKQLGALVAALRKERRTRFVVLLEGLSLVPFGESYYELVAVLSAASAAPRNVLIVATARQANALRPGDAPAAEAEAGALARLLGASHAV
jgi:hypothetical protein